MIAEFALPDLGEGLPEAEIVQWLVAEGDDVTLNQPIAEVETAKAIVELPSPYAGTVRRLHATEGEVVAVGSPLIGIDVPGSETPTGAAGGGSDGEQTAGVTADGRGAADDAPASTEDRATPNLVGYGAAPRGPGRPRRRPRTGRTPTAPGDAEVRAAAPHDVLDAALDAAGSSSEDLPLERPRSTPPVRQLAKRLGVDLALVAASGVTGVIAREDVERFAEGTAAEAERDDRRSERGDSRRVTRTPIRGVRRATAAAMVRSAFTAPHVTCFLEVDVTETTRLVTELRADPRVRDHRIGVLVVVAKAVCLALRSEPALNSRWDEEAGEIIEHHYVDLGIAAATERGLIVPHVRDAHSLTLAELADAIAELTATARAGRSTPAALSGGTFSLTNFGVFGVDAGTPILNPPQAGILGIGTVRRRPWEHEGEIALRDVLTLSLSFDHRVVDGEQGARFLRAVGDVLRAPGRAMLLS
ncbi:MULTISPECIES: dihydrolipoamide acetyltransferase family protein [unclassified Microbacterium]|uniref:dihydrolipoamide acetyltransferase family protein n=1 Tax=unclassified Microbacterium TaxID=2609290 RepID=UPI00301A94A7